MSGEQRKAVIKNADMDEKMQQDAVDIASKALSEYNIEKVRSHGGTSAGACVSFTFDLIFSFGLSPFQKDVAAYIKKEFDRKYSPTWYVTSIVLVSDC